MRVEIPKYLMLVGKNAFPGVTYEDFLNDIINVSHFFQQSVPLWKDMSW